MAVVTDRDLGGKGSSHPHAMQCRIGICSVLKLVMADYK